MKFLDLVLVVVVVGVVILGCAKEEGIKTDCINDKLESLQMVPYDGQEIGCKTHLALYHLDNKQYFHILSACALIETYPVDCEGNTLCVDAGIPSCPEFVDHAEFIEIVGISE